MRCASCARTIHVVIGLGISVWGVIYQCFQRLVQWWCPLASVSPPSLPPQSSSEQCGPWQSHQHWRTRTWPLNIMQADMTVHMHRQDTSWAHRGHTPVLRCGQSCRAWREECSQSSPGYLAEQSLSPDEVCTNTEAVIPSYTAATAIIEQFPNGQVSWEFPVVWVTALCVHSSVTDRMYCRSRKACNTVEPGSHIYTIRECVIPVSYLCS